MPKPTKWFEVKNQAEIKNSEILIYGDIVSSKWYDEDVSAVEFSNALKGIPSDHEISVRLNSRGGNVWAGMAIYQMLNNRGDKVTCYVDGVAASIASVIACAGKKTVINAGGLVMIHPPSALPYDSLNADECRKLADKLDKHAEAIAAVYAKKTGKSKEDMLAKMNEGETWMTATDAKDFGIANEISGEEATAFLNSASDFDFSAFRKTPEPLRGKKPVSKPAGDTTKTDNMNKTQIIAFLKENGVTVADDASDEVIMTALKTVLAKKPAAAAPAAPADNGELGKKLDGVMNFIAEQKKANVTAAVDALIADCRVTAGERDKVIARAIADETYIAELRERPQVLPGAAPINGCPAIHTKDASINNALKEISANVGKGGERSLETAADRSKKIAVVHAEARDKIIPVLNAAANNAIDTGLKRVLILQETVRDFATRVLPARLFCTVFENVPLQGTDEVEVPYYPLQTAASSDFTEGDNAGGGGYQFGQATNTSAKKITVNKRKYQPLDYSSQTFSRQPWFDAVRLGKINAEKLGVDTLTDILSVITAAKYGAAVKNIPIAGYTSDDVIDLKGIATKANWPDQGRALIVDSDLETVLQKDPAYKLALNIGTADVIQKGKFPNLSGFDFASMPNFPTNGENLVGIIAFASAIAAAFAPVAPAAGVRQQLVAYEMATDLATGISLNYRHWGVAQQDRDYEVIETAYGYSDVLAAALKRLTKPA